MKKFEICLLISFMGIFLLVTTANAEILGCFQKNHGQLRIVSDHSQCLNSESPITLGEGNNQEPPPTPEPPSDNSKFYGIYGLFEKSGTGVCGNFIVVAINGDPEMQSADYYLHIPRDNDSVNYTYTDYHDNAIMEFNVSVMGNIVTMIQNFTKTDGSSRFWTTTRTFTFSEDYSTLTIIGYNGDDTPFECMGELSGYGQRISCINN